MNKIVIYIVGFVGVVVLLIYIISSKTFPSLGEFRASSTNEISGDVDKTASTTNPVLIDSSKVDELKGTYATNTIYAPKGDIQVEISDTQDKMELGLSNRSSLDSDSGMLFIFPNLGSYSFWMKDMYFPLDIVWINTLKEVTGIASNVSPDSFPEVFNSPGEIQFVLELNAGEADKFGIATGTALQF